MIFNPQDNKRTHRTTAAHSTTTPFHTPIHNANIPIIHTKTSNMLAQSILSFALLACGTLAAPTPDISSTINDLSLDKRAAEWKTGKCEASISVNSTPSLAPKQTQPHPPI
jgi:hypothetical protein